MHISRIKNNQINLNFQVEDGDYLIKIIPLNYKTSRESQEYYFALIDEIKSLTGWSRYDLHNAFKADSNVATTTKFTFEEWCKFIEQFKFWILNNFDIII